ncbi:MAG: type II secretion system F family protein [Candidatus Aenigmarchaeota archaeon]|nr:type II secretion system F family protein [Candidatus Aenigmarchaeota archaeon]
MGYVGFATLLFGRIVDKNPKLFSFLKECLVKSEIKIPVRSYVSVSILTTIIVFISTLIIFYSLYFFLKLPEFFFPIYVILMPLTFSFICLFTLFFSPYQIMQSKRKNIETNLPFVLTHMSAIAESGVPPYVVFKIISNFKEYGEIAKEMKKIVRNIEVFGTDPVTAAKEVAKRTPSESLRQLLLGFVTTTEAGGSMKEYLKTSGVRALFEWRIRRERFLQQLTTYAEIYIGLLIAAPLFIISLFAVMNTIPGATTLGGIEILSLMELTIYVILPVLNIGFLMFLRSVEVEM